MKVMVENNLSKILWFIFRSKKTTRQSISKNFRISSSMTTVLVGKLKERDFLREFPLKKGGVGRSPNLITVNPEVANFCGVDMSAYEVKIAVYNFGMEKVLEKTLDVEKKDPRKFLTGISRSVNALCREYEVKAVGVALPGILESRTGVLTNSAIEELEGLDVLGVLRAGIPTPVFGINDANAATLAEYHVREGERNILGVFISKGIGAGMIIDGELVTGANGYAGEFGNMRFEKGRVDELLSGERILEKAEKRYGRKIDIEDMFVYEGIEDVLEEFARNLADALMNLVFLLDPGLTVILSRSKIPERFIELVRSRFEEYLDYPFNKGTRVEKSILKDDPPIYGAVIFAIRKWIEEVLEL